MNFTNNQDFKTLLNLKKQEIVQRTNDGVQETFQFRRLLSLLVEARRRNEEKDSRHIIISKQDLSNLCENADEKVYELFRSPVFLTNRTIYIDNNIEIKNSSNDPFPSGNNEARRYFTTLSEGEDIGFLVFPNATLNFFINGKDFGDGIFYSDDARKGYEELKTIEHLEEVLDEYRITLEHQNTYMKFFVPKTGIMALRQLLSPDSDEKVFLRENKHLLNNKPEERFREDIRNYIKSHMKVVVAREVTLEDLDRLDIELYDEVGKDMYFLEIKWVGKSINADGNNYGTEYKASPRIKPDAVRQVVGYIDELLKENQNVKIGYLAVFDARVEDLPDTGYGVDESTVQEELRGRFPRFKKLKDFRVKNINPR